jgi:hypothetical protein
MRLQNRVFSSFPILVCRRRPHRRHHRIRQPLRAIETESSGSFLSDATRETDTGRGFTRFTRVSQEIGRAFIPYGSEVRTRNFE